MKGNVEVNMHKNSLWFIFLTTIICFSNSSKAGMFDDVFRQILYPYEKVNLRFPVSQKPPDSFERFDLDETNRIHLVGWFKATSKPNAPTVLYFHGNGENIAGVLESNKLIQGLMNLDVNIALYDYPSYGLSTGVLNQNSIVNTGLLVLAKTIERFPGSPIVLLGWSLGAAVAIQVAATAPSLPLKSLILISPWNSMRDQTESGLQKMPWILRKSLSGNTKDLINGNEFDSASVAKDISLQTLLIHGKKDQTVEFTLGEALAKEFDPSKIRFISMGDLDHSGVVSDSNVLSEIISFMNAAH